MMGGMQCTSPHFGPSHLKMIEKIINTIFVPRPLNRNHASDHICYRSVIIIEALNNTKIFSAIYILRIRCDWNFCSLAMNKREKYKQKNSSIIFYNIIVSGHYLNPLCMKLGCQFGKKIIVLKKSVEFMKVLEHLLSQEWRGAFDLDKSPHLLKHRDCNPVSGRAVDGWQWAQSKTLDCPLLKFSYRCCYILKTSF